MSRLKFKKLDMDGLYLVERVLLGDDRGFLSRIWCSNEIKEAGWKEIAQINHTYNQQCGTVRDCIFKKPHQEKS